MTTVTIQQNLHRTKEIYSYTGRRHNQQKALSTTQVSRRVTDKAETPTLSNPSKSSSGFSKKTSPKSAAVAPKAKAVRGNNAASVTPESSFGAESVGPAKPTSVVLQTNGGAARLEPHFDGKAAKTRQAAKLTNDDTMTTNHLFYVLVGTFTVVFTVAIVLQLTCGSSDNIETVANQADGKISWGRKTNFVSRGEKRRPQEFDEKRTMLQLFVNNESDACSSATVAAPKIKSDVQQHERKQPAFRFGRRLSSKEHALNLFFVYVFFMCMSWFTCKCIDWYDKYYPPTKDERDVEKNILE